ncbi:sugar phosphate nucleotidyltransferase [Dongshaea marina]|uniref:sugar phosphate nucleotidyltransferase n=1 Tax=Dongshaea marina TaxID=2047966 RepID=UPI0018FF7C53|nr:sugar phosphate nucleotidyltransferase [Dongshaea marina]
MTNKPAVPKKTIGMVLAGGKGSRLIPLTRNKSKPCVAFGGQYKIIDFVLSNFFNSGIKNVYILTQYHSYTLNKHIRDSWGRRTGMDEFFDAISPETSSESEAWFQGTADAINHYLRFIETSDADYVAIFGGDHIYKMDIRQMIDAHTRSQADISIAALEVGIEEASRFGILSVDNMSRVTAFSEKPQNPATIPGRATCLASMGNYIFSREKLISILKEGKQHHKDLDFGMHVIPMMLRQSDRIFAYNFNDNLIPGCTPRSGVTGKMWAPLTPTMMPTWISSISPLTSISTITSGPSIQDLVMTRRPKPFLMTITAAVRIWTPMYAEAVSPVVAWCAAPSSDPAA